MNWSRISKIAEEDLHPYDVEEKFRKYFPVTFMRYENFIHRNLVMSDKIGQGNEEVSPENFYISTLPEELKKELFEIQ